MNDHRGPRYKQLPLWRAATRFLLEIEDAVRRFPRYHKYTLGSDLRRQAMPPKRGLDHRADIAPSGASTGVGVVERPWPR